MAQVSEETYSRLYDIAERFQESSPDHRPLNSFADENALRAYMRQYNYTNSDIVEAYKLLVKGESGTPAPNQESHEPDYRRHRGRFEYAVQHMVAGHELYGPEDREIWEKELNRSANHWEKYLKRNDRWMKKNPSDIPLGRLNSFAEFKLWQKTHPKVPLRLWYYKQNYDAKRWEQLVNRYDDKPIPEGKKIEEKEWFSEPENMGLHRINTQEQLDQWKQAHPQANDIPDNVWELHAAYQNWERRNTWEGLTKRYPDKMPQFKTKGNMAKWRSNLALVGLGSLISREEFIEWKKANDLKDTDIPDEYWDFKEAFKAWGDPELGEQRRLERIEEAKKTEAPILELSGAPVTVYNPSTNKPYSPPPSADFSHPSGETSDRLISQANSSSRRISDAHDESFDPEEVTDEEEEFEAATSADDIDLSHVDIPAYEDTGEDTSDDDEGGGGGGPSLRDINKFKNMLNGGEMVGEAGTIGEVGVVGAETATVGAGAAGVGAGATGAGAGGAGAGAVAAGGGVAGGASIGLAVLILIIALVIIAIVIIILMVFFGGESKQNLPNVSITKSGPAQVNNKDIIPYTISVTTPGTAQEIVVTDNIPDNAEFYTAEGSATIDYLDKDGKVFEGQERVDVSTKPERIKEIRKIRWTIKGTQSTTPNTSGSDSSLTFDENKFKGYGFPPPENPNPHKLSPEEDKKWKTYLIGPAIKAANATGTDVGIIGIWSWLETSFNPFADNCADTENDPNTYCFAWGGNWQVASVHPASVVGFLPEAFDVMYGNHSDSTVQTVGNAVLANSKTRLPTPLTIISSFPAVSVDQIVSGAKSGDQQMRTLLTVLMKDDALDMFLIAKQFKENEKLDATLADRMDQYDGANTYYTKQDIINRIKGIYDGGIVGGIAGTVFTTQLKISLKPTQDDSYVLNKATVSVAGLTSGVFSGDITKLLPNPVPPDPANAASIKEQILARFRENQDVLFPMYKQASQRSGLPWQIFAGLHWRESDATPNHSFASGRLIGTPEPDRAAAGDCNGPVGVVDGKADTNCVFASAEDDAIFAANHLIGTIGKVPSSYQEMAQAFSRYNGTGNTNCGRTPYAHCPPEFEGDDSPYALNFFDDKHSIMFLRYCSDGQLCADGTPDSRAGALTVSKWVAGSFQ